MAQPLSTLPVGPVTLGELVERVGASAIPLTGVSLTREVSRVGVILDPARVDWDSGTVWFLCTLAPLQSPSLDAVIMQVWRGGSAGLVIPETTLFESTRTLARRIDLPIIGVQAEHFTALLERWWRDVALQGLQASEHAAMLQSALLELSTSTDGLASFLERAGELIGARVDLSDDPTNHELRWGRGRGTYLSIQPVAGGHVPDQVTRALLTLAGMMLDRDAAELESDLRLRGELLLELLTDNGAPTGSVIRAAERFGLDLGQDHLVVIWDLDDFTALSRRPDLTEARIVNLKHALTSTLEGEASRRFGRSWVLPHLDAFVLVLEHMRERGTPSQISPAIGRLRESLRPVLDRFRLKGISAGIGLPYSGAAGLRKSFEEAHEALLVGRSTSGPGGITHFQELGLHRFLYGWYDSPRSRALAKDFLKPLFDADPHDAAKLFLTLKTYLESHGRSSATAKALGIHRNSLRYRLDRIQDILNLNLEDPNVELVLNLAVRLISPEVSSPRSAPSPTVEG